MILYKLLLTKHMLKPLSLLLCMVLTALQLSAQEINANVVVNYQQVQTTETRVFADMEKSFKQFLNSRKWTNDEFATKERINCNFVITITDMPSIGQYKASVQIQSSRPVYNASYESIVLNFADRDWEFDYVESQPLDFNLNNFTNNITSILAYYAYVVIGLDYDTFGELGGTEFYEKARQIVNNAAQQGLGWDQFGDNRRRNRYWLVENLLNQQMVPIRQSLYKYHRTGLDTFLENEEESRANMLAALGEMQKISKLFPQNILLISFFDAKNDEIVDAFSRGDTQVRRNAYNTLVEINPTATDTYAAILEGN